MHCNNARKHAFDLDTLNRSLIERNEFNVANT